MATHTTLAPLMTALSRARLAAQQVTLADLDPNEGGSGLGDVTVAAVSSNGWGDFSANTAGGSYSFASVPSGWAGTLTPSKAGYAFTPASRTFPAVTADQAGQDFTAQVIQYTISGRVINTASGLGINGIEIKDGTSTVAITGACASGQSGCFSLLKDYHWTGTLYPDGPAYIFSPDEIVYAVPLAADETGQDFQATIKTFTVSGTVLDALSASVPGVTVNGQALVADAFSFTVSYGDNITLTPHAIGYSFTPAPVTFSGVTENKAQDFTATVRTETYTLSGVVNFSSVPMLNALVQLSTGEATLTNAAGAYSFIVPYSWIGAMTASKTGYVITAAAPALVTPVVADQVQDFNASPALIHISGRLKSFASTAGAVVTASGYYINAQEVLQAYNVSMVTAANGYFQLSLPYSWRGTVRPVRRGWAFRPSVRSYTALTADVTGMDHEVLRAYPLRVRRR